MLKILNLISRPKISIHEIQNYTSKSIIQSISQSQPKPNISNHIHPHKRTYRTKSHRHHLNEEILPNYPNNDDNEDPDLPDYPIDFKDGLKGQKRLIEYNSSSNESEFEDSDIEDLNLDKKQRNDIWNQIEQGKLNNTNLIK